MEALVQKAPRWFLILLSGGFMILSGLVMTNIYNDSQKTKNVAYEARTIAESITMQVAEVRGAVQEIKNNNETFRKEYREDQKDTQNLLKEVIRKA